MTDLYFSGTKLEFSRGLGHERSDLVAALRKVDLEPAWGSVPGQGKRPWRPSEAGLPRRCCRIYAYRFGMTPDRYWYEA